MKVSVETRRYGLIYQINNIIEARSINSVPQLFYPDYLSVVKKGRYFSADIILKYGLKRL